MPGTTGPETSTAGPSAPWLGSAEAIAVYVFVQAIFFSFAFGSPLMAVFAEWRFRSGGDKRYLSLARDLTRLNVWLFGAAAVVVLVTIFLFALIWPSGLDRLLSIYLWPWLLMGSLFLAEGVLLAYYVHPWPERGLLHLAAGAGASLLGLALLLNLNSAVAAMFAALPYAFAAEGRPELLSDRFAFLPLDIPGWTALAIYRAVGALSLSGLAIATGAALLHLRAGRGGRADYLRWLSGRGLRFGLLPLLALPLVAVLYVSQSPIATAADAVQLAIGNLRWAFSLQMVLIATLLLLGNWYLVRALRGVRGDGFAIAREWMLGAGTLAILAGASAAWYGSSQGQALDAEAWAVVGLLVGIYAVGFYILDREQARAGADGDWSNFAGVLLPLVGVCAALVLVPFGLIFGEDFVLARPWPWQLAAVVGLATLVVPSLALYLRARRRRLLVPRPVAPALLPVFTGLAAVTTLFVLGYVRDVALGSTVLYRQLVADQALIAQPSGFSLLAPPVVLWLVAFAALLYIVIVWLALPALRAPADAAEPVELRQVYNNLDETTQTRDEAA